MTQEFYIVDAFTPAAFRGNPAAVCIMKAFPDDETMQLIAAQINLSETVFVVKMGPLRYSLRWFTPEREVALCGHATLAATHILRQTGACKSGDLLQYETLSGPLKARLLANGVELDFPTLSGAPAKPPTALKALGVEIVSCEKNRDNYLVEVKDFDTLLACAPNFKKLGKLDAQGVIVTAARGVPEEFDFASRYFAPAIGVDEDPVCGSAHCFLAPYWAEKLGKNRFRAFAASKGRGVLDVTLDGERTLIAGQAVTTLRGTLSSPQRKERAA